MFSFGSHFHLSQLSSQISWALRTLSQSSGGQAEETNRAEIPQRQHLRGSIAYNLRYVDKTAELKWKLQAKGCCAGLQEHEEPGEVGTRCLVEFRDLASIHVLHQQENQVPPWKGSYKFKKPKSKPKSRALIGWRRPGTRSSSRAGSLSYYPVHPHD